MLRMKFIWEHHSNFIRKNLFPRPEARESSGIRNRSKQINQPWWEVTGKDAYILNQCNFLKISSFLFKHQCHKVQ
jgi:hypothetical protein